MEGGDGALVGKFLNIEYRTRNIEYRIFALNLRR